jgi:iron complex outermembrane receptor protein
VTNKLTKAKALLLGGSALIVASASPALAQDQAAKPATQAPAADTPEDSKDIVVTGSIVRNPAAATASPVVSFTADELTKRGLTNVADALQTLTANNQGTAPPSWSSFGFATGASAVSLRGLNDAYTLTLFNGLRSAPYPLGDDGYRNFVDINTIPSSMVDRIDVLQDGASATYGSDAIAGVINVIVKREVQGLHLNASSGISQRGDAGDRFISGTYGYGDLEAQRFNIYVNGEYESTDGLKLSDRSGPFGTADQSSICSAADGCLTNGIRNGIQYNGVYNGFQSTTVPYVRPYTSNPLTGGPVASQGGYQLLNPAAGCQNLTPLTLTTTQRAGTITPATVCQQDLVAQYRYYTSPTERKGLNLRATFKVGDNAEAYAMFNFYNTTTQNYSSPSGYTGQTAAGGAQVTVSSIYLPAYVCAAGVGQVVGGIAYATGCNAANGTLNPNNPFAASGQLARLVALPIQPRYTLADTKTYRFTAGIDGSFWNGINYSLTGTASAVVLDRTDTGYIYLQGLLDGIAKGTFNFVDPTANSTSATQGVFPNEYNHSTSKLTEIVATFNKDVFKLPGGELNIAVSGQYRYEAIHNPSSNAPNNTSPNSRYYGINAVGVDGKRDVWSGSYEVTIPIFDQLKVKADGSYDTYSTGQSRFSPKFEAEFRPIQQIKFRGTYSKGFRIPSFSESFALPTTGYVTASINCASATYAAFCAAHANNPSYYAGGYSYGLTSAGNTNLKPERSENITAGVVFQPTPRITLTADYWQIKLKDVIIPTSVTSSIISAYYTNNGVVNVPGIQVTPGVADQANPNALPLLGNVIGSYQNADSYLADGIDFSASGSFPINSGITFRSKATASMLIKLQQTNSDGTVSRYDGTLGACNITSCSGAPRWRIVWLNTVEFNNKVSLSLTGNYTSGYSEVATDSGGVYGDCATSTANGQILSYNDGNPVQCVAKSTFYLDGHIEVKTHETFTLYMDVKNIFDRKADYEPNAAYGLYQFNPAWQDSLFIGRYMRVGAKVDF